MDYKLTYLQYSERSILVKWPNIIDENILNDVLLYKKHLKNSNIKSIVYINNAYNSILVIYDLPIEKINDEILRLKATCVSRFGVKKSTLKLWKIPVCYDEEFALDLNEISNVKRLQKEEIIRLHSETIYTVFFIGFLPGFLYLGGMDNRLRFPRRSSPRLQIEKGAVGIGGAQTGIYPNASPGGWNIIGNSPLNIFNPKIDRPCFASAGDRIQFIPVRMDQYQTIKTQVDNGTYQIESEVIDG